MIRYILTSIIILTLVIPETGKGQENNAEIIKKAIRDELKRNIDSISNSSCGKPFFLSYMVRESKLMTVTATLGAITQSSIRPSLSSSSRMLLGDYHINDENFSFKQNSGFKVQQNIRIPREPDYWGIRRALWASTERIYARACKSYQTKKMLLADNGITSDKYLISDFSKAPVVKLNVPAEKMIFNQKHWEHVARKVSAVFADYPEIAASQVAITILESAAHFINNEGTEVSFPLTNVSVLIYAYMQNENNVSVHETFSVAALHENELPSLDSLENSCRKLINALKIKCNTEKLKEEYNGPVLFEGEPVASLILNTFFNRNGLIAQREPLNSNAFEFRLPFEAPQYSLDSKINTQIVSKDITIKSLSRLKEYNGEKLVGAFDVDAEGVVPPEELILVKNGMLLTLLNGRTPTFGVKKSNGHNRLNAFRGKRIYPGVVHLISNSSYSKNELKEQLLALAKEQENEFAYIIRQSPDVSSQLVYKIDVKTGAESLINVGHTPICQIKDFKKGVLFSGKEKVSNLVGNNRFSGMSVSVIAPDAILIKELKISPARSERKLKAPAIKSPLSD